MTTAQRRRVTPVRETSPLQPPLPEKPAVSPINGMPENSRIGDILRRVRDSRGEHLEAISDYVKIRPNYLHALEASRYQDLPADTYAVGFLRTYADYLGLDGKAAVAQFRREIAGRRRPPELYMPQPVPEGRAPTTAIVIGGLLLAMAGYAFWYSLATSDRASIAAQPALPVTVTGAPASVSVVPPPTMVTEPAVPAAVAVIPTPSVAPVNVQPPAAVQPVASTVTQPPNAAGQVYGETRTPTRLQLKVSEQSWVLISNAEGQTLFDKILRPGDIYKVPNIKGLTLTTGNGAGVIVMLDGRDLPRLGDKGRVVRNVPLDSELLASTLSAAQNSAR